jgi:large subunit ribosomal protein L10
MNKQEKTAEIESLKALFAKTQLAILTDYKGLKVNEFNDLRRKLRASGSELKVVKNRLAKIALKGTALEVIADKMVGTTALTTALADPVGPAKVITDFAKDNEKVVFKAAAMGGKLISKLDFEALAKLPSKEVLIAKLMGSMLAPATNLVSVLSQIPRQLVTVLAAIRDQKEKQ